MYTKIQTPKTVKLTLPYTDFLLTLPKIARSASMFKR